MQQKGLLLSLVVICIVSVLFTNAFGFLPLEQNSIIIQTIKSNSSAHGTLNKTLANNTLVNTGAFKLNFINGSGVRTNVVSSNGGQQVNITIANTAGASGVTSLNGLNGALTIACVGGNTTCTTSGGNTITINTAWNIVTTGGSNQTITKGLTLNDLILGSNAHGNGKSITALQDLNSTRVFQSGKQVIDTLVAGSNIIITGSGNSRTINATSSGSGTVTGSQNVGKGTGSTGVLSTATATTIKGKNVTASTGISTAGSNSTDIVISTPALLTLNSDASQNQNIVRDAAGNITITNSSAHVKVGLGSNVVITGGQAQEITKPLTIDQLILGGDGSLKVMGVVSIDNVTKTHASHTSSVTLTQTLGYGSNHNRAVIVGVSQRASSPNPSVPTATYNGASMSQIIDDVSGNRRITMFELLDSSLPSVSGNYNIVITYSTAANDTVIGARSLIGVNQTSLATNTNHTNAASGSPANILLTTQKVNAFFVDLLLNSGSGAPTPLSPQVQDYVVNDNSGGLALEGAASHKTISASGIKTWMNWTVPGSGWNIGVAELDPVLQTISFPISSSSSGLLTTQNIGHGTGSVGVLSTPTTTIVKGKNVTAGSGISVSGNTTDITISATGGTGTVTGSQNVGKGTSSVGVLSTATATTIKGKNVTAGTNISVSGNTTDITISSPNTLTTALLTTQNVGKGTGSSGVLATPTSTIVKGKNLTAGTAISISNNSTDITISTSALTTALVTVQNIGHGTGSFGFLSTPTTTVVKSKNATAGTGISLAGNTTDITFTNTSPLSGLSFQNVGKGGKGVLSSFANPVLKAKNLTSASSANLTISSNTTDVLFNLGNNVLTTGQQSQEITKPVTIDDPTIAGDGSTYLKSVITVDNTTKKHAASSASITAVQQLGYGEFHNRAVIVGVQQRVASNAVPTVTYNGVSMTQLVDDVSGNRRVTMFGLQDSDLPGIPGSYNIVASFSVTPSDAVVGAASFIGVNQTTSLTVNTNHTDGTSTGFIFLNMTTQKANAVLVDALLDIGSVVPSADGAQTQDYNAGDNSGGLALEGSGSHKTVASPIKTSMKWNVSGAGWNIAAIELDPVNMNFTSGIVSLNNDYTPKQNIVRDAAGNMTITNSTATVKIGLGYNVVMTGLSAQEVTKAITLDKLIDLNSFFVDNGDNTKKLGFELSGETTGITSTIRANGTTNQFYNLPDTKGTQTFAFKPQLNFTSDANGTATTSATVVMYGGYITITPQVTGRVEFTVTGIALNSVATDGCRVDVRESTSNMGANGAAAAGTVVGTNVKITSPTASANMTLAKTVVKSGLALGTKTFWDLGFERLVGGTCKLNNLDLLAKEE